jgi:ABC-type nitrate/sulfonate/bicarbonate transport system permease component
MIHTGININVDLRLTTNDAAAGFLLGFSIGVLVGAILAISLLKR